MHVTSIRKWAALALALVTLAAGCARDRRTVDQKIDAHSQAARAAIREHVTEKARAEQLLALVGDLDKLLREQRDDLGAFTVKLHEQNADPATAPLQIQQAVETYLGERRGRRAQALEIHFQMVALTRPDEWKHIVDAELAALRLGTGVGEG